MVIFEQIERHADALRKIGEVARTRAHAAGGPVSYMEDGYGDDIVREYPDGHRERVGQDGVATPIPPRAR